MIVAATDTDWIFPLLVVVFGFIQWVAGKLKEKAAKPAGRPNQPAPTVRTPTASPRGESAEDERMRKFLEALGVPADSASPAPAPAAPPPQPRPIAREAARPKERRVVRPAAPPPLPEKRSLDEAPEPTLPVERIELPTLAVSSVPEFTTVSSRVGAIPNEQRRAEPAVATDPLAAGSSFRDELRSPQQLRRAFILRELLGPPRGLQSQEAAPTLRPL